MLGPLVVMSLRSRGTFGNVRLCSGHFVKASSSRARGRVGQADRQRESGSKNRAAGGVMRVITSLVLVQNNKWG